MNYFNVSATLYDANTLISIN